jgi:hypothetical protein
VKSWRSAAARRLRSFAKRTSVESAIVEIGHLLTGSQHSPPIDLKTIFPLLNVREAIADPDLLTAGELRLVGDEYIIAFTPSDSGVRQRFTIAHELGHVVFERTGPHCPRRGHELEQLCDLIASEILIPQRLLYQQAKSPISIAQVTKLAKLFDVSITSMAVKCAQCYPLAIAQIDFGELSWCMSGISQFYRPRAEFKGLVEKISQKRNGTELVEMKLQKEPISMIADWQKTGPDRSICLLRKTD